MTLNQRRTFLVAFDGVLVASPMYVATFALLSCYERVFITKKMQISGFGIMDLRTTEPFRSDSRTFFFIFEPSDIIEYIEYIETIIIGAITGCRSVSRTGSLNLDKMKSVLGQRNAVLAEGNLGR